MIPTLVIRNALLVTPQAKPGERADVVVRGESIAEIVAAGTASTAGATLIDAHDRLLMPGLANAHTHSPTNVLKGTGDALSHPAFMWRNQADTVGRTPDEVRLSALLGCIEHLLAGTTSIIDHFPEQGFTDADVDAVVDAYRIAGLRATVALRIFDEPYTDIAPPGAPSDGAGDDPLAPPPLAESLALVEAMIARHDRTQGGRIRVCPAPSESDAVQRRFASAVGAMAKRHDTAVHMHLLETAVQADIARRRYGRSMVAQLDALGLLNDRCRRHIRSGSTTTTSR